MRKIAILVLIFGLAFPTAACAKHYGPLWAVWTHSEDPEECAIKTAFWTAVITATVCYVGSKMPGDRRPRAGSRLHFAPAVWMEPGREVTPIIGFTVRW